MKKTLDDPACEIDTVYIDDFTRASRDELEWWRLADLMKRKGKRLIGASDGFDLTHDNADVMLTMYGLLSRLFIKTLRQKVRRGMVGAVRRGTCVGKAPLGYCLRPACDAQGGAINGKDDERCNALVVDPEKRKYVELAFELFGVRKLSRYRIARHFNRLQVDGGNGWTAGSIKKVLRNRIYIGMHDYNKTRQERDIETGRVRFIPNSEREWIIKQRPDLRIVSDDLWQTVQDRLDAKSRPSPVTGKRLSRNEHSASTLFSGTMFCGYCGAEIKLTRSGKLKVMGCNHGIAETHGCKLRSCKSLRIIEESLLGFIKDKLVTEDTIEKVCREANAFLVAEAAKPRIDTSSLRASIIRDEAKIQRLVRKVEDELDENASRGYHQRIKALESEVAASQERIRQAEARNQVPTTPISLKDVKRYLDDFRGLLNQDTPAAAEYLRTLTGPIEITQEPFPPGKPGAKWIASFQPNLPGLLARTARIEGYLDCATWEYLGNAICTERDTPFLSPRVEVIIDRPPKYEQLSAHALEMADSGIPHHQIAKQLGVSSQTTGNAIRFARWGVKPQTCAADRPFKRGTPAVTPKYIRLAAQVRRLRDVDGKSFPEIATELSVCEYTVDSAYRYSHGVGVRKAKNEGELFRLSPFTHRRFRLYAEIQRLAAQGHKARAIANILGLKVRRVFKELARPHKLPREGDVSPLRDANSGKSRRAS